MARTFTHAHSCTNNDSLAVLSSCLSLQSAPILFIACRILVYFLPLRTYLSVIRSHSRIHVVCYIVALCRSHAHHGWAVPEMQIKCYFVVTTVPVRASGVHNLRSGAILYMGRPQVL